MSHSSVISLWIHIIKTCILESKQIATRNKTSSTTPKKMLKRNSQFDEQIGRKGSYFITKWQEQKKMGSQAQGMIPDCCSSCLQMRNEISYSLVNSPAS